MGCRKFETVGGLLSLGIAVLLVVLSGTGSGMAQVSASTLLRASWEGDLQQVKRLVHSGAQVDSKDKHGQTALMWAVSANRIDIARFLLHKGADPNMKLTDGTTALQLACKNRHVNVLKLLLDRGAKE